MIIKLIFITLQQSKTTKKNIFIHTQSCYYILYTHIDKHHPH